MKKILALVLSLVMIVSAAACGSEEKETGTPEILGVVDTAVEAGTEFDAMAGITATDGNGDDLTGKIMIESSPSLTIKNGKTVPEKAGNYELTYSVTGKS